MCYILGKDEGEKEIEKEIDRIFCILAILDLILGIGLLTYFILNMDV